MLCIMILKRLSVTLFSYLRLACHRRLQSGDGHLRRPWHVASELSNIARLKLCRRIWTARCPFIMLAKRVLMTDLVVSIRHVVVACLESGSLWLLWALEVENLNSLPLHNQGLPSQ